MEAPKKIDWSTWKLRCSSIGQVMGQPKLKADKEAGNLSQTAKSFLLKEYIRVKYGRKYDIKSKYLKKGLAVEEDNITLYSRLKKKFFKKNTERLSNEWIEGEPDLFEGEIILVALCIIDLKSSWDIFTFYDTVLEMVEGAKKDKIKAEKKASKKDKDTDDEPDNSIYFNGVNPEYYWQLMGYKALTGASHSKLAYGLIDTPDALIEKEKASLLFEMGGNLALANSVKEAAIMEGWAELERKMKYEDIPIEERLIEFHIDRNNDHIEQIYRKVEKCREYLQYLDDTLTPAMLASYSKKAA